MAGASEPSRAAAKIRPQGISGAAPRSAAVAGALERSLFVIPSINGGSLLRRMLPTLHLPPHTVVVLDQGSTDDTEVVCQTAGVRLVQLGRPHTYTEAGNIGAHMARDLGCDFVFIANNDIAFTTDVGAELIAAMLDDPRLAIAAPSQVIVDEKAGKRYLAYKVEWHLDVMRFMHDFRSPNAEVERLEADLCELTCAVVRMTVIDDVGFLDDDFGFYHEDADFCFRLRQAGHSCAYLPGSQIEHYTTSTFSAGLSHRKRAYMERNAELFARKHLGYGVGRLVTEHRGSEPTSGTDRHLPGYLRRFGLLEPGRPALVRRAPGSKPFDYLHLETLPQPTDSAFGRLHGYRGLVAGSDAVRRALVEAGFEGVGRAAFGIETDIFHPWAAAAHPYDETTFLLYHPHREGLDAVLRAWSLFRVDHGEAHLVVVGAGILGTLVHAPARIRRWGDAVIADYPQDGVTLREISASPSDEDLAALFRSVDAVVSIRPDAVADIAAALACGTLALFPCEGPAAELASPGAIALAGAVAAGVWMPDVDGLADRMREVHDLDRSSRRALAGRSLPIVRSSFTWRSTCAGLSSALSEWQQPEDVRGRLRRLREAEEASLATDAEDVLFVAMDTGEAHPEADKSPRPAVVTPALLSSIVPAETIVRLSRRRRLTAAGRRAYGTWRTEGKGATVRLVGRAVALRAGVRLRWLIHRFGGGLGR